VETNIFQSIRFLSGKTAEDGLSPWLFHASFLKQRGPRIPIEIGHPFDTKTSTTTLPWEFL